MPTHDTSIIAFKNKYCKWCKHARFSEVSLKGPTKPGPGRSAFDALSRPITFKDIYCNHNNYDFETLPTEDITLKHISKCRMLNYQEFDIVAVYREKNHISYK